MNFIIDDSNKKYILVYLTAFAWFFSGIFYNINIYDEGIGIVGSLRVLSGEVPYIDFWTVYSPLWYYLQALFILIFGDDLVTIRLLNALINSSIVLMIFSISEKEKLKPYFPALAVMLFIGLTPGFGRAVPMAILTILISLYFLFYSKYKWNILISGGLIGILFGIRHDFAAYFTFSTIIYLIFERKIMQSSISNKLIHFIIGLSSVSIAIVIFLLITQSINDYISQAYIFVFNHFSSTRALPLPLPFSSFFDIEKSFASKLFSTWESLVFYLPILNIILGLYLLKNKKIELSENGKFLIVSMLLTMFLLLQGTTRSDFEHILPSLIISMFIMQIFFQSVKLKNKFIYALLLLFIIIPPVFKNAQNLQKYFSSASVELASNKAKCIKVPVEFGNDYNELLNYLKLNLNKDKYIYSGVINHDRIYINDVMLYYLSNKRPLNRYHELHPKQATEEAEQIEILYSLDDQTRTQVNWLVLLNAKSLENNLSSISSDIKILDGYIGKNYILQKYFGMYFVFKRIKK